MCLRTVLRFFGYHDEAKVTEPPKITRWILSPGLANHLHVYFPTAKIYLSDGQYGLVKMEDMVRFLAVDLVSERGYIEVKHDCDDFSFELLGHASDWCSDMAFGLIWVVWPSEKEGVLMGHALNWFMDDELNLWLIEPQSDRVYPMGEHPEEWEGHLIVA